MQLCNVTPGMRVRAVNLRACDIKYSAAKEIAHFVSKTSSLQVGQYKSTNTDAGAGAKVQILTQLLAAQALNLRDNDIDGMGATCLAKALTANGKK